MTMPMTARGAPSRRMGRSVGAVFVGFVIVFALSTVADVVLHAMGVFPPWDQRMSDPLFILATAYRVLFTVLGGYVTARMAPNRPIAHSVVLGVIGIIAGTVGAVATWNRLPSMGPHWYPVLLVVTALPATWLGGVLYRGTRSQT